MPTAPADCLAGLIGLSAAGVACWPLPTVPNPADNAAITDSASALYLDRVEGLLLKPATGQAAGVGLYPLLTSARAQATEVVRTAIAQRSRTSTGVALFAQRGTLGGLGNGALLAAGSPARMSLYTQARRFGGFRIVSVQLYTNAAVADVPLLLDGVAIGTLTTTGPGGAFVPVTGATPAQLRIAFDGTLHTLEAVLPTGVRVHSNALWCAPCQRNTPWGLALGRNLYDSNAAGFLGMPGVVNSGGGFAVQVQEECTEPLDALCYALSVDPELRQSVAFAVQYKAAELFTLSLAVGAEANRYLSMEPKALNALGQHYQAKAEEHLAWLAGPDGIGRVRHPCYAGPAARMDVRNTL